MWYMKVDYMQLAMIEFLTIITISIAHKYYTPISDPITVGVMAAMAACFFLSKWVAASKEAIRI